MNLKTQSNLIKIGLILITLIRFSLIGYGIYSIYMLYHLAQTTGITAADWIWYGIAIFLCLGGSIFNGR